MYTSDNKQLTPQKEEHITEAIWKDWKTLELDKLDSYASIQDLLKSV
jgi:hypothetical protein